MEAFSQIYAMPELKECPVEATFRIVGKRWTILILREMFMGVTQFNRFMENVEGISPKMLSIRLKELQRFGIVKKRIVSEEPIRVAYQLTDRGRELAPILTAAARFSMTCLPEMVFKDGKPRTPEQISEQKA